MTTQPEALRLAEFCEGNVLYQPAAAELRRLHQHEFVNEVWQVKTQWVQDTAKPEELGMHRADVMRQRLEQAKAQREALLEALRIAEAALSDIGDADREPGDDVAWCEARAAEAIPQARAAIAKAEEA